VLRLRGQAAQAERSDPVTVSVPDRSNFDLFRLNYSYACFPFDSGKWWPTEVHVWHCGQNLVQDWASLDLHPGRVRAAADRWATNNHIPLLMPVALVSRLNCH